MSRLGFLSIVGVAAALATNVCLAQEGCSSPKWNMDEQGKIATFQKPAEVVPSAGQVNIARSPALTLTLRPIATEPDSPFLAQVLACAAGETSPPILLGTVSFYPLNNGKSQNFVLPSPINGFDSIGSGKFNVIVRLVPANPNQIQTVGSVEVLDARFAE